MNAYKDRIAEKERGKERKRARVERGAGDVLMEHGNRVDDQMAVRHADASGGDIRENQHEENIMRDIQVGKRGSEAASEEQPNKLRKAVQIEQEAPSASASSDPLVWNILRVVRHKIGWGPYLCRSQGHVDDDVENFCVGSILRDGWTKESLPRREMDARDLKRSELNDLVENLTCLNAFGGEILEKLENLEH